MTNLALTEAQLQESPFDSIRHYDEKGIEFWKARELQKLLGYRKWQMFEDVIAIGIDNLESAIGCTTDHLTSMRKLGTLDNPAPLQDYKLSRIACYHIALACDSRGKPEVKAAKHYFAVKAREAEVKIPRLESDLDKYIKLEELRMRNKELDNTMLQLHGREVVLVLAGKADAIVKEEIKVTEVINLGTGTTEKFLSADQLKVEVKKRTGQTVKSLKAFTDVLRNANRDDLLIPVTRQATSEYIHPDRLDEAISIVYGKQRQKLIGE